MTPNLQTIQPDRPETQIMLAHRHTDQRLQVCFDSYLADHRTRYRNWRLVGQCPAVSPPQLASLNGQPAQEEGHK